MTKNKNTIKTVFRKTGFIAQKLLQGNVQNNPLEIPTINNRPFFKKQTMIYEGYYQNKSAVLKIVIEPKNNLMRFRREIYAYTKLTKKFSFLKNHLPEFFTYSESPVPYFITEKLTGQNAGDWFKLKSFAVSDLKQIIKLLNQIHTLVSVTPKYAYRNRCQKLNKYLALSTYHISETLKLLPLSVRNRLVILLKNRQEQAQKNWHLKPRGFVFNDFSPSNIFLNKESVKFLDLETIGNGPISNDLSLFCFAGLGTPIEKQVLTLCLQLVDRLLERAIFDYFLLAQLLIHTHKLRQIEPKKYKHLVKYLSKLS